MTTDVVEVTGAAVCAAAVLAHSAYVVQRVWRSPDLESRQRWLQLALVLCVPLVGAVLVHLVHRAIDNPEAPFVDGIVDQTERY